MAAFSGKDLVLKWITAAGTLTMNTDYQQFDYNPSIEFYDQSAGNDTHVTRLAGMKDGAASYKGLFQAGDLPSWGTALERGTSGTLVYYPEGTAAGKYAGTIPMFSQGLQESYKFKSLVEANVSWLQNGAESKGVA